MKIVVSLLKDQNQILGISLRNRVVEKLGDDEPLRDDYSPGHLKEERKKV